jgi:diguanylate cyclase (GGDEF)-like protein
VDGYLVKPIDRNRLIEKLNTIADAIVNERRRRTYLKLLSSLFDSQKEIVFLVDREGAVQFSNLAFKRLCMQCDTADDETVEELFALFVEEEGCASPSPESGIVEILEALNGRMVCLPKGGGKRSYYELHARAVDDLYLVEMQDITHLKRETMALARENLVDPLTGLYNRKIWSKVLAWCEEQEAVCYMFFDIDHFKRVNDTYGHSVGDETLKTVAEELRANLRNDDYLIRWGGEEFLLVTNVAEREKSLALAEKLRKVVEKTPIERVGHVTVSVGICGGKVVNEEDAEELLELADAALYMAKNDGRNRVEICGDNH